MDRIDFITLAPVSEIPGNVIGLINRNRKVSECYCLRNTCGIFRRLDNDDGWSRKITDLLHQSIHATVIVSYDQLNGMQARYLIEMIWIADRTLFLISKIPLPA